MTKLTSLFAALMMASTTLLAETMNGVKYIDADGVEQTADSVNIITNAASIVTWGQAGQTTWYVVTGTDVQLTKGAICNGNVNLILADGAKLTSTGVLAGIQVSGEGNSLTIYAQSDDITMGTLIANGGMNAAGIGGGVKGSGSNITINGGFVTATSGGYGAGIGGGWQGNGFNITINGGRVTATGGESGAGIGGGKEGHGSNITINGGKVAANGGMNGAGIGGGYGGSGSYITINDGTVTANGGEHASGIGGGEGGSGSYITINGDFVTANGGPVCDGIGGGMEGSGSNIFICVTCRLRSGGLIHHDDTDIADLLAGKASVSVYTDVYSYERNAAYAAINALIEGITDEDIQTVGATAIEDIFQEDERWIIDAIKTKALADLQKLVGAYNSGKAAGLGSLAEPCDDCHAVEVKKGTTVVTLYAPDEVKFKKTEAAE